VVLATVGVPVQRRTKFLEVAFKRSSRLDPETARVYADRFRDPLVARTARDTYRTFLLREIPQAARNPETRRATVPIRALFGVDDAALHPSMVAAETANADDYTLETVDASHFVIDERPDVVRAKLVALADETKR
jgi:pimeloyl-ACP methyl ester carboxylesterase